jgi:LuxR family transcriptional regulator, maltose regulon positive regulatory protein
VDTAKQESFGALLRRYRVAAGLSQEALAERAQMSARGISDLERGLRRFPQPATVMQLMDALELEPADRAALEAVSRPYRPAPQTREANDEGPGREWVLLETKLAVPRARADLIPRARLITQLDHGLQGPLTVIAAPTGYGKSTLIAAWHTAQSGDRPAVAWVSLDEGDSDPAVFWTTVFAALERVSPGLTGGALPSLTSSSITDLLARLVNRLSTISQEVVLVLDDYHVIASEPIHQSLAFLLDHLPPSLHLLIASRADPPLPLGRLRARRLVTELRADDLRFTAEEAAAYLSQTMGLSLQPDTIEALEARTEGWIAGLQLAALSLQGRSPEAIERFIATFSGSHRYVVDYLVDEVLGQQTEALQTFLLRTSILDRFSAPLASFVLTGESTAAGDAASQTSLEELDRRNVFVVALDDVRQWYRYHHLFGDALRQRLCTMMPEAQVGQLHRRAAVWLERQGLVRKAIDHLIQAQAYQEAGRLVAQAGWALLDQGVPVARVGTWMAALPEPVIRANPRLCTLKAMLAPPLWDEMDLWLHRAETALEAGGPDWDDRVVRGEIAALRTLSAARREETAQVVTYAEQALELLSDGDWALRGIVGLSQGLASLLQGDTQGAERAYAGVATVGTVQGIVDLALVAGENQAFMERMQGALGAALATCEDLLHWVDARAHHSGEVVGPVLHAAVADLLREQNDLDGALRHITLARAPHGETEILDSEAERVTSIVLARVEQARGDLNGALATARQVKEMFRSLGDTWSVGMMEAFEAQVWVAQGNLPAAMNWYEHAGQTQERPHLGYMAHSAFFAVYEYEHLDVAPIQVLIAQGRSTSDTHALYHALDLVDEKLAKAQTRNLPWLRIKVLALQALAHDALRDTDAAQAALGQSLELAAPEGYVRIFLDEGVAMADLLQRAVIQSPIKGFVQDLLAATPMR